MNQCLEEPAPAADDTASEVPVLDDEVAAPVPATEAVEERAVEPEAPVVETKGRVLLLEDDAALREIITDLLVENGYSVLAVQNGGEGVREVLAADFAMVFCDFRMPGLPGDMFYRAVEKIRPALCHGFIFMTGNQDDERTSNFIKSVNGFVLRKPFLLRDLLDSMYLAEVRRTVRSVFDAPLSDPVVAETDAPAAGKSDSPAEMPVPRLYEAPAPRPPVAPRPPRPEPQPPLAQPRGDGAGTYAEVGFVLLLILGGLLGFRYAHAQRGAAATFADHRAAESEWRVLATQLEAAKKARVELASRFKMTSSESAKLLAERARPRWTPALRGVVRAAGTAVELREIHARGQTDDSGACEVRINGVAGGPQARLAPARFREALEAGVKLEVNGRPVSVRIARLDDEFGTNSEQPGAAFVIVTEVGVLNPTTSTEAR